MNGHDDQSAGLLCHAAALYRKARVATANDARLLVDVHDAAIACVLSPSSGNEASTPLLRAHALVSELQATLQPEHDAALAHELSSFYDAILQRIVDAYLQEETQPLLSVAAALRELRSAWSHLNDQRRASS
ncbi:MAG: Flagellar protein FliS [Pseudomonadota bacterium]